MEEERKKGGVQWSLALTGEHVAESAGCPQHWLCHDFLDSQT